MAAKVNVKFVAGLVVALVAVATVVVVVGSRTLRKSPQELAKLGEDAEKVALAEEAAGKRNESLKKWEESAGYWSRAVNRAQGNTEYVKRWVNALERCVPKPAETYKDIYRKQYLMALQAMSDAKAADPASHTRYLELMTTEAKLIGNQPLAWEGIISRVDALIRQTPELDASPAGGAVKRYRGMARVALTGLTAEQTDDVLKSARADLDSAVAYNPEDSEAAAATITLLRYMSGRERGRAASDVADALAKEAREYMAQYLSAHPTATHVLVEQVQFELQEAARNPQPGQTIGDLFKPLFGKLDALLNTLLTLPPERIDRNVAWQASQLSLISGLPDAAKRGVAVLDHIIEGSPTDVLTLFRVGELEMATGGYKSAQERLEKLVKMPDLPLSSNGILLFGLRDEAIARQAECALALWNATQDEKERAAYLAEAKSYRDKFVVSAGQGAARTRLLDGKLKFAEGDNVEARRLLDQYNNETTPPRSDIAALRLLADILLAQNNVGGARMQLERILELNGRDVPSILKLARIEAMSGGTLGLAQSAKLVERALEIEPGNEGARKTLADLQDVLAGGKAKDPLTRVLASAQEKVMASPPDISGARDIIRKAAKELEITDRNVTALANRLVVLDDREAAKELLNRALAKYPDSPQIKSALKLLEEDDPLKARLMAIDGSTLDDASKEVLRFQTYLAQNDMAKADEALAKAKAAGPEQPVVISALFDRAVMKGDKAEVRRLSELAVKGNIDRLNGLIFRVRAEMMDQRYREALAMAQQAKEIDPLNPIVWRLLGSAFMSQQPAQINEALQAFEKGLQLRPDDVESLKGALRCRVGLKQYGEALALAREKLPVASGDPDFGDIWLTLEGEVGDAEKAIVLRQRQFERSPDDRTNAMELVGLLVKQERWEAAEAPLAKAKAKLLDADVVNYEARILAGKGDVEGACKVWEDYIAAAPPATDNKEYLRYPVTYANFLQQINQRGRALAVLQKVRDKQTDQMEIDREIGDLAFNAGDWELAAQSYSAALAGVKSDAGNVLLYRTIESQIKAATEMLRGGATRKPMTADERKAEAQRLLTDAEEKSKKIDKGGKTEQNMLLLRADIAMAMGEKERVRSLLDQAIQADTTRAVAYLKRAEVLLRMGDNQLLPDAKADLQQALRIDPKFAPARQLLAKVFFNDAQQEQGLQLLRDGVALDPTAPGVRTDMVQMMMTMGKTDEAKASLEEIMKKVPDAQWRVMMAQLYESFPDFEKAAEYYAMAWKRARSPQLAQAYANVLLRVKKVDLGLVKEIINDPSSRIDDNPELLLVRADVARREKRVDDSNKDIAAAFKFVDPADTNIMLPFTQKIRILTNGDNAETVAILRSLEPAGGFPEAAALEIARVKLCDKKLQAEGVSDIDRMVGAAKRPAEFAKSLMRAGDMLYMETNFASAAEVYRRASALMPNEPSILNNLAYTLSKQLSRHQEALPLAEKAVEADGTNPNYLDTLGAICLALGDARRAERVLTKGLETATTPVAQVPLMLHLVEANLAQGRRPEADRYYSQVQRAFGRDPRVKQQFEDELVKVEKKLKGS